MTDELLRMSGLKRPAPDESEDEFSDSEVEDSGGEDDKGGKKGKTKSKGGSSCHQVN